MNEGGELGVSQNERVFGGKIGAAHGAYRRLGVFGERWIAMGRKGVGVKLDLLSGCRKTLNGTGVFSIGILLIARSF